MLPANGGNGHAAILHGPERDGSCRPAAGKDRRQKTSLLVTHVTSRWQSKRYQHAFSSLPDLGRLRAVFFLERPPEKKSENCSLCSKRHSQASQHRLHLDHHFCPPTPTTRPLQSGLFFVPDNRIVLTATFRIGSMVYLLDISSLLPPQLGRLS